MKSRPSRPLLLSILSLSLPLFACGARSPLFDLPSSSSSSPPASSSTPPAPSTRAILFGGTVNNGATTALDDTWQWDGTSWTQLTVPGPPARYGAAMASLGTTVLLTGGWGPQTLTDTWAWDGNAWTDLATTGPSSRIGAALAPLGNQLVLFGGFVGSADPNASVVSDTWIWNGAAWVVLGVPGPSKREHAVMATLDGKVILFGGSDLSGTGQTYADTWAWDGISWTELNVAGPPARDTAVMVPFEGKLFLFGGNCYCPVGNVLSDTWTWDGTAWTEVATAAPAATFASMAEADGQLVLFGGLQSDYDDSGTTRLWNGDAWTSLSVSGPSARDQAAIATLPAR